MGTEDLISRKRLLDVLRNTPDIAGLGLEPVIATQTAIELIEIAPAVDAVPVVRCKDCKHYEVKDHWGNFGGVPILAASDVPTCHKWSDGCMTKPDGYCFMGERRNDA